MKQQLVKSNVENVSAKNTWRKDLSRMLSHYTIPDIVMFKGTLSYYQTCLDDQSFSPVVVLSETEAPKNPQTGMGGRVYFILQSDCLQVFNKEGHMVFDKGRYLRDYASAAITPGTYARPEMIPDGAEMTDWINWCYNGYTVKVFTDAAIHVQDDEPESVLHLVNH